MADKEIINKVSGYLKVSPGKLEYNQDQVITRNSPKLKCSGFSTILQSLVRESTTDAANKANTNFQLSCLISQWFDYIVMFVAPALTDKQLAQHLIRELDRVFGTKSYLVEQSLSVADVALFYSMHSIMKNLTTYDKEQLFNLSRWYSHLQALLETKGTEKISFSTIHLMAQTHI